MKPTKHRNLRLCEQPFPCKGSPPAKRLLPLKALDHDRVAW